MGALNCAERRRLNLQKDRAKRKRSKKSEFNDRFNSDPEETPTTQINGIMRGEDHLLLTCGTDILGMTFEDIEADLADEEAVNWWPRVPVATFAQGDGYVWRMDEYGDVYGAEEGEPGGERIMSPMYSL